MKQEEQKKIADLVKQSLRPMNRELARDLWPEMLLRLDESARDRQWCAVLLSRAALSSVPWFDWTLLAVLIIGICAFPSSIPIWLYHF
jgi:membrane glycosyltransferase